MLVSDIIDGIAEVTGSCSETVNFARITRAIQLLANTGLFDPLIGNLDFSIDGSYWLALPRDVKTPIRINISRNPSFIRSRLFEFTMNTEGSVEGEEVGWSFSDKGYLPIQNQMPLPGLLNAKCVLSSDNGKTIIVNGKDGDGMDRTETLVMASSNPTNGLIVFYSIDSIVKDETINDVYLRVDDSALARYQSTETDPQYRIVKLSKTGVACRMVYRKHVFKITSLTDIIPLHSEMAVIMAADAVQLYLNHKYTEGEAALKSAVDFIKQEQASRDEFAMDATSVQITTATDNNITTRDSLIVADIYDEASEIVGPQGRVGVLDAITDAVEALANKGKWDSTCGTVDIWKAANCDAVPQQGTGTGIGYFVLPRYVEAPLAINVHNSPQTQGFGGSGLGYARNRWYEFHLNGTGERDYSACGTWDDMGEVVINNKLPLDPDTRKVIPQYLVAIPTSALDDGASVVVFGAIRLADGTEQEKEYTIPCTYGSLDPGTGAPQFIRINRIVKDVTTGFVQLYTVSQMASVWTQGLQLGYWYPDEVEPKYRLIKVPCSGESRIRMRFRKRFTRFCGLSDPIFLRSRLAITNMLRAIEKAKTDPEEAMKFEAMALEYLKDEQTSNNGVAGFTLQFDKYVMAGNSDNFS